MKRYLEIIKETKAYKVARQAILKHKPIVAVILVLAVLDIFIFYPAMHKSGAPANGQARLSAASEDQGWVLRQGKTFYYTKSGEKVKGEQVIDGRNYYFDERIGNLKTGWLVLGEGTRYYCADGTMATGAVMVDGRHYYFDENGFMHTGWLELDGQRYYYGENGQKYFGRHQIDGQSCFFAKGTGAYTERKIDPNKPMVALTFDDGPSNATSVILDQLEAVDGLCTFFIVANRVEERPDVVRRAAELGCELANHSWSHEYLSTLDEAGIREQLDLANDKIEEVTGVRPTLMRPTGGGISDTMKTSVDMPMICWSVDTEDWKTKNANSTCDAVLNKVYDGAIVLMHDLYDSTAEASKTFVRELVNRGYQLVTVSELAEAKGFTLENGQVYYDFYRKPEETSGGENI